MFELRPYHRLVLHVLIHPGAVIGMSNSDWELLIRMVRRVKLLSHLTAELKKLGLMEEIPVRAANLLNSDYIQAKKLQQQTQWELNRVQWALKGKPIQLIALKGVAYALAELPETDGRQYVDLDLIVPKYDLLAVESILKEKGWNNHKLSAYDEHYYRQWSHEIPPLVHGERQVEVDIHHTITPVTSSLEIDSMSLINSAVAVENSPVKVLSPVDMVLHCAVNLFQNNELADDLRDLLDLHHLLRFFSQRDDDFWEDLVKRANQFQLGYALYYGLHFSRRIFKTAVPVTIFGALNDRPGTFKLWIMNRLVPFALLPFHPDNPSRWAQFSRFVLYLRSHLIRMPLRILIPHLAYKSFLSVFPKWRKPGP